MSNVQGDLSNKTGMGVGGHLMGGLSQSSESNALQKQAAYTPQVIEKYPASKHDLAGYELIGNLRLSESFLCIACKTLQLESSV